MGDVKPWDLLNPNQPKSDQELIDQRMDICKTCPFFTGKRCRKCGCFMALKTTLRQATCPIGKW